MTKAEDTLFTAVGISTPRHVAADLPVDEAVRTDTATSELDRAAVADDEPDNGPRHVVPPDPTTGDRDILHDRRVRLQLLAGLLIGMGCLLLAYRLHPGDTSPFAAPANAAAWFALIAGVVGIWLVPGLWLSAVMMRVGAGPAARLATRIGATLTWYALVGPVVHLVADGARVTRGGIFGVTVSATAAVCLGIVLGLVRRPTNPWLRFLIAGTVGGLGAQTMMWVSMQLFTNGVNYEQIRRLDWFIVIACALLTAIAAQSRPDLRFLRSARHIRTLLIGLGVVAATTTGLFAVGGVWSPAQLMPSAFSAEQIAAPPGTDVAFALTAIGPDGPAMIQRADITATDVTGRPVAVSTRLLPGGRTDPTML